MNYDRALAHNTDSAHRVRLNHIFVQYAQNQLIGPNPDKAEITNYKHQITNKFQITISKSQINQEPIDWNFVFLT